MVGADLTRSGQFRVVADEQMLSRPTEAAQVDFRDWQLVMAQYLTIGRMLPQPDGRFTAEFELFNVATGQRMTGARFPGVAPASKRRLAHHIADLIYEAITGVRGVFGTRVTYVTQVGNNYELQIADADGYNPVTVLRTQEPILSPTWSADGRFVAYATYANRRAAIFRQDVSTGVRQLVSSFPGLNGAPAFSPDGGRIAMVLSKDGNPDIYVMDLAGGPPRRVDPALRHRHRADLVARRALHLLHVRSQRWPAGLSRARQRRRRGAGDLRRQLQHPPGGVARRAQDCDGARGVGAWLPDRRARHRQPPPGRTDRWSA